MRMDRAQVLEDAGRAIHEFLLPSAQKEIGALLLKGLSEEGETEPFLPYIDIALLVYAGIRGDRASALPLAVVTTLLYLGIDTLDNLADDDRPDSWKNFDTEAIRLTAITLVSALPQLLLSRLKASPQILHRMQATMARDLLRMSHGQFLDLSFRHQVVDWRRVEESVQAKSGEELAMFAALAAEFAGAEEGLVENYRSMGQAMGTAGQIASDCHDLFQSDFSRDLKNGTRTLPIAIYLQGCPGEEKNGFLSLLDRARTDRPSQEIIQGVLKKAGGLRICSLLVELYCQSALTQITRAQPLEPSGGDLKALVQHISFYPR